jgi:predicted dehydrogenase
MNQDRRRIGIVGCGDVAHRHYLPGLASRADIVEVAAASDPRAGAADAVVAAVAGWSPAARSYHDLAAMLSDARLDAVVNLTPAPLHAEVNRTVLEAGVACYSEKPIASDVATADVLIELAQARGVTFLCAPGSAVSSPVRWLKELATTGRYGTATLAIAHHADPGPADWLEYTGDPTPFYGEGVGPLFDHGVYRLHEMTSVLGPVQRLQAMGTIALPTRVVRGGPMTGRTIDVTTPDHVLVHLAFASGALGQLLASFATADTLAPWLEVHFERGVVSFGGKSWELDAPVSLFDAPEGPYVEWRPADEMPRDAFGVVQSGIRHFVACLAGEETPVLTAEHARHVLEIMLATRDAIADSRTHDLETTFAWRPD